MSTSNEQSTPATTTTHPVSQALRFWQGEKNPHPDVHGLFKTHLDWRALSSMRKEDRENLVIKRANFFYHCFPLTHAIPGAVRKQLYGRRQEAAKAGNLGKEGIDRPGILPLDILNAKYKRDDIDRMMINYQFVAPLELQIEEVKKGFQETIAKFEESELCRRFESFFEKLCRDGKFDKIVAFGTGPIAVVDGGNASFRVRNQVQHASMLTIRRVWEHYNPGKRLSIYLQDPAYNEHCVEVAYEYNMRILDGDFGHQMGWLKIDKSTLVMSFACTFPVQRLVSEIARPAALYFTWGIVKEFIEFKEDNGDRVFSSTLALPDGGVVDIPGLGATQPVWPSFDTEYSEKSFNVEGLSVGREDDDPSTKPTFEGYRGFSHLGSCPKMYIRK
ncbi:uncharacterized protein Bfra_007999 [Botrytis fragariae]|uniref:SRR1-like domain-containing protein n=1 Tax=Botrytis fragariae TaxID=1964551 RepID=A0A8H6APL6_9HELO|nr:uncharacterized protein Bfra_007999 [Botrytis fragariae]KAF5871481.1 hypothetical protein Bfra_007999 [Botrytis fragariae]